MAQDIINAQEYWKTQAAIEAEKSKLLTSLYLKPFQATKYLFIRFQIFLDFGQIYQHGKGPCNVFLLDTSLSLGREGFVQLKGAFTAILDGEFFKCNFRFCKKSKEVFSLFTEYILLFEC